MVNLKKMSVDKLRDLVDKAQKVLDEKIKQERLVRVKWVSFWTNYVEYESPYLAILSKGRGSKYNRKFLDVEKVYCRGYVRAFFDGFLPEGTCLQGNTGCIYGKPYIYFYVVDSKWFAGLRVVNEEEVKKKLGLIDKVKEG